MPKADKYRDLNRYRTNGSSKESIPTNVGGISSEKHADKFSRNGSAIAKDNLNYKAEQYSRSSNQKYSHRQVKKKKRAKKRSGFIKAFVAIIILAVIGVGVWKFFPIKVDINGKEVTLTYDKTLGEALKQNGDSVQPGNFVAVDYSVLQAGQGYEFYSEVNGNEILSKSYRLHNGDQIKYENGHDIMEEYSSKDSNIAAKSQIKGNGAIHKFSGSGEPGTWSKMTGKVSGNYAERQTKDPSNVEVWQHNVNPGKDKVIALTFDDGPSEEYTQTILDTLKKYNAHATFFVVGERLEENWGKNLVKKEYDAGHQVCTHSYDHARGAGGTDITGMTAEKQIEEITKGKSMISKAIGRECSSVVRLPGGNLTSVTARLIAPYVSAEIGWNIDTGDWEMPGKDKILSNMKLATSGDVILCHDGGGDRKQTVAALQDFLKIYTEKDYKFITIDEMMQYQEAEQKNDVGTSTSKYSGAYN